MFRNRLPFNRKLSPPPGRNIYVITFIFFIILLIISLCIIASGIKPALMEIAERKTAEFATRAINAAVKFAENYTFEDIAETTTDHNGNVTLVGWDSSIVNQINRAATEIGRAHV